MEDIILPRKFIKGKWGWLALAMYITLWDSLAIRGKTETLSYSFWDAIQRPKHRWWVILSWVGVTGHLFHLIPESYDPLRIVAKKLGAK